MVVQDQAKYWQILLIRQRSNQIKVSKDPIESKYQLSINGRGKVAAKKLKNPKAFTDYSQTIDDVYENLEDYDSTKKRRMLTVVFDDLTHLFLFINNPFLNLAPKIV